MRKYKQLAPARFWGVALLGLVVNYTKVLLMIDDNAIAYPVVNTVQTDIFDYDALEMENRSVIKSHTDAIKERIRRSAQDIVDIGELLIDVKDRLPYGQFGLWLQIEFGWDERTARRFMSVAAMFKTDKLSELSKPSLDKASIDQSALYLLAAKSTPQEVRREVLERAYQGESMTHAKVKQIVQAQKLKLPATKSKRRSSKSTGIAVGSSVQIQTKEGNTQPPAYKQGDIVAIAVPRKVNCDYKRYNGCWAVVNGVGALGSVKLQLAGKMINVMNSDVEPIDNPPSTFKEVAQKVSQLLDLEELDEMDRQTLEFLLRRQVFNKKQLHRLNYIWNDYFCKTTP